jgi:protein-disulfide isomerase/uncharacterized membrane protein
MNQTQISPSLRQWMLISIFIAAIGTVLSIYASHHQFELMSSGSTDSYCNINDQFSCDDVARSEYSTAFGIPLGVWGLGFFIAQIVILILAMAKPATLIEHIYGQVALTGVGLLGSIALALISAISIGKYCLNCIGVYSVCLVQFLALLKFRRDLPTGYTFQKMTNGGLSAAIVVGLVAGGFHLTRDSWVSPKSSSTTPSSQRNSQDSGLDLSPVAAEVRVDKSPYSGMGEDFRKGSDEAKAVIVEFADFQCPACKSAFELLKQVQKNYGDRVQIVFKNYPLDKTCNSSVQQQIHAHACEAAVMARCAGMQGKFWEMSEKLFNGQAGMDSDKIKLWALSIGLTEEQINGCRSSKDILAKIADDVKQGNQLNVNATPTIFINGRQILGGRSYETIQAEIERILAN